MFEKLKEHWWSILIWWLLWITVLWISYLLHYNIVDSCQKNPIYLDSNWVTVKAKNCAESWKTYQLNWETYYVAIDKDDAMKKIFRDEEDKEWNWEFKANRVITSRLTNMKEMFLETEKTTFNQDISNWDTSNVTDMSGMFAYASSFDQSLNNWNTSKVTEMSYMFQWASSFDQPIWNWNTKNVTNMEEMFAWAELFNQPLNSWNTSNVTNMKYMFRWTRAFNQNINNWNTSNVTDIEGMLAWAISFKQDVSNWNVNNVLEYDLFSYLSPIDWTNKVPTKFR